MATLNIPDSGVTIRDPAEIRRRLADLGIDYERWELRTLPPQAGSDEILETYQDHIAGVKARGGYTTVDVINVNPETPGLDTMLNRFSSEHWHDEDEVRFTLDGRGIFHIHASGQPVMAIEVGPGDMIRVPRGTHHWFNLCEDRRIKSIRFFQDTSGWTPHYTNSSIDEKYQPVCFGPQLMPPIGGVRVESPVVLAIRK